MIFKNHDNFIEQLEAEFLGQEINLLNLENLSRRAKDLADCQFGCTKLDVYIPPQVIENGIVEFRFFHCASIEIKQN